MLKKDFLEITEILLYLEVKKRISFWDEIVINFLTQTYNTLFVKSC